MGLNNEYAMPVIFDLETVAIDGAGQYLEPASAPANYKDAEKIAAYIADANQKALDKAALDLDLCRIVALGFAFSDSPEKISVWTAGNEEHERELLGAFWGSVGNRPLLGFNCLSFDVPVLMRRSLYLGVDAPPLQLGKYKHPSVIDLMQHLSFDGLVNYRSLSFYCKRFGLDVPDDGYTGADIARLVAEANFAAVDSHCRADVSKTLALARRIGLLPMEMAS